MLSERFFLYSERVQLGNDEIRQDQHLRIRENADFYMRGLGFKTTTEATIAARMRRADASWFTGNQLTAIDSLCVTGGFARWTPIYPQIRYPAGGAFIYDLQDLVGNGDANIYPLLIGVERYAEGALPAPALPDNYIELAHYFKVPFTLTGAGAQSLDLSVRCNTGDAFAIRSLSYRYSTAGGAVGPDNLAVRLRDEYGRSFMNDWVPLRLLFAGPTEFNSPVLATPYPQLVIPANGAFSLDVWNRSDGAVTNTVELVFGGVRCVASGAAAQ